MVACRIIVSAPVPFPFLWTLDLGFGTWIWDLDLGLDLGLTKSLLLSINEFWWPNLQVGVDTGMSEFILYL